MQTVNEFFVGLFPLFQLVEVAMVINNNFLDLFSVRLVYFRYFIQQVHDDLDVLDLFSRFNFSIEGEAVVVGKDWFWIFGHHDHLNLVFYEL